MDKSGHHWNGWPGAVCINCGLEDQGELCMAGCRYGDAWLAEMLERDRAKGEGRYRQDIDVPECYIHVNPSCPIHQNEMGKWFFWIETWADEEGPYDTEEQAREAFQRYCKEEFGP